MRIAYHDITEQNHTRQIFVYSAAMRVWHWLNALTVIILCVTGYLIGTPLPSFAGDPSTTYVMGWIRLIHLTGGYVFAALCILRVWNAVVGNIYARQLFVVPFWRSSWMAGLGFQLAWNLFLPCPPRRYKGLNPLAHVAMVGMFVLPTIALLVTGFGMLAEVAGHDSWQYHLFGWMRDFAVNTIDLHTFHRCAMWVVAWFIVAHIYSAVREDIVSRQTMVSTMLSGFRVFKD